MGNVSMRVEAYKGYENKEGSKAQGGSSLASFCPVIKKRESNVGDGGNDSTDAKEQKSENVESKCPVKNGSTVFNVYSQPIDPTNNMPANPNQLPRQGQRRPIDTSRVKSSIPKGGTDEDTWTYPSPQMFYNALNRKGKGEGVDEDDVETIVAIHNNMNERTWNQVMKWEKTFHCDECPNPKLLRFIGRPDELSPMARFRKLVYGQEPFDRHDWTIDRCGKEVRYIIDYYHDESVDDTKVPHLRSSTDIKSITMVTRPALDSFDSLVDRAKMLFVSDESDTDARNPKLAADAEIKTVGPQLSSSDVFKTIQTIKENCEKPARILQNCSSDVDCEKAQLAMDLCFGKIVAPASAKIFQNNPSEETYEAMMDDIAKFQKKATM